MNLKEAIKIHNELCSKEEIKKYCEALHIVCLLYTSGAADEL